MSWHHSDYISLISAIGGMVAAGSAAFAAFQSNRSARESSKHQQELARFERNRYLRELLRLDALKASESLKSPNSDEWVFSQIANVANALESARLRILEATTENNDETSHFKKYFKSQLSHEITKALSHDHPPECIHHSDGVTMTGLKVNTLWLRNKAFFNFSPLRLEDLAP